MYTVLLHSITVILLIVTLLVSNYHFKQAVSFAKTAKVVQVLLNETISRLSIIEIAVKNSILGHTTLKEKLYTIVQRHDYNKTLVHNMAFRGILRRIAMKTAEVYSYHMTEKRNKLTEEEILMITEGLQLTITSKGVVDRTFIKLCVRSAEVLLRNVKFSYKKKKDTAMLLDLFTIFLKSAYLNFTSIQREKNTHSIIKELVSKQDLVQAVETLFTISTTNSEENSLIILISSELNGLIKEELGGTVSTEYLDLRKTVLAKRILGLNDLLNE